MCRKGEKHDRFGDKIKKRKSLGMAKRCENNTYNIENIRKPYNLFCTLENVS